MFVTSHLGHQTDVTRCRRPPLSRETPDLILPIRACLAVRSLLELLAVSRRLSSRISLTPELVSQLLIFLGSITRFRDNLEQIVFTGGSSSSLLQWLNENYPCVNTYVVN